MDPLSEVFSLLDIQSAATSRLETAGAWAVRFPPKPSLKFHAVLRGSCWITLPGESPCRLEAGDTFLLANSPAFVLASDPQQAVEEASQVFSQLQSNIYRLGGDENVLLGGGFVFESGDARLLLDALPPFLLIPAMEPEALVLRGTLNMLDKELENTQMGSSLMTRRLGDILLVQVLRAYVNSHGPIKAGWIGALSDRRIGAALSAIHADVGHHWTVDELASIATMSRSGLAVRFKELVGISPLDYVLRWRMQLARDALHKKGGSIASLASRFGYASKSAFSNAFKRVFGQAPTRTGPGRNCGRT